MDSFPRATKWLATAGAAALLGVWACGDGDDGAGPATPPPATRATAAPTPPEPSPEATPEPAATAEPAAAGGAGSGDPKSGEALYAQYCASCHGARGEGDGPVAASLNPKPVRHTDGAYMNQLSDQHLFKVIKDGGAAVGKSPLMAPWGGTLSDAQIWDLVAFIRTLAEPPYQP